MNGRANATLSLARAVADAVLYEGYLLYPYRASSQKNQSRWQFGILGPPGAAESGIGEESGMFADVLLEAEEQARVEVHLRCLRLQSRTAQRADGTGFVPVDELSVGPDRWLTWDEAVEQEVTLGPFSVAELEAGSSSAVHIPEGLDVELVHDPSGREAGRLVRRRRELTGEVRLTATRLGSAAGRTRLRVRVEAENTTTEGVAGRQDAIAVSFIGAHLLLTVADGDFLSLLEPPAEAAAAAAGCRQHRCWPVLAGPEGQNDVVLVSPIILYDHPAVAEESAVALFDATEIDEILTLRVLTLTDEEKAQARSTDPRAAAIIDACEAMTPEELQQLHGVLRDPHAGDGWSGDAPLFSETGTSAEVPWWNPEADASVQPDVDAVMIDGVPVARGSRVRVDPQRHADAQDLFFAGRTARVTSVHFDVDGATHVGLVFEDDPAADLHDDYGRSFYFAPDELQPLEPMAPDRKEVQT